MQPAEQAAQKAELLSQRILNETGNEAHDDGDERPAGDLRQPREGGREAVADGGFAARETAQHAEDQRGVGVEPDHRQHPSGEHQAGTEGERMRLPEAIDMADELAGLLEAAVQYDDRRKRRRRREKNRHQRNQRQDHQTRIACKHVPTRHRDRPATSHRLEHDSLLKVVAVLKFERAGIPPVARSVASAPPPVQRGLRPKRADQNHPARALRGSTRTSRQEFAARCHDGSMPFSTITWRFSGAITKSRNAFAAAPWRAAGLMPAVCTI